MSDVIQPGKKDAERAAKLQQQQLREQRTKEKRKTLEAEDDIARRRALAQGSGGFRRSLLAGAETGTGADSSTIQTLAKNLGG